MQGNRIMTGSERRYMVYGIGNGLVDKQVKITDSELEDLRLSKGFMELADQAEQGRILAYLGKRIGILHALFSPHHREPTHRRASGWPALDTAGRPPARTAGHGPDGGRMTGSQRGCERGTAEETGSNALAH